MTINLWLPTAGLKYAEAQDLAPGALLFSRSKVTPSVVCVGIKLKASGGSVLAVTPWPDLPHQVGDVMDLSSAYGPQLALEPQAGSLRLEIDPFGPLSRNSFSRDSGGPAIIADGLTGIMACVYPGDIRNRATLPVETSTWAFREGGLPSAAAYCTTWRLRLHLSEREVFTVAESPAPRVA